MKKKIFLMTTFLLICSTNSFSKNYCYEKAINNIDKSNSGGRSYFNNAKSAYIELRYYNPYNEIAINYLVDMFNKNSYKFYKYKHGRYSKDKDIWVKYYKTLLNVGQWIEDPKLKLKTKKLIVSLKNNYNFFENKFYTRDFDIIRTIENLNIYGKNYINKRKSYSRGKIIYNFFEEKTRLRRDNISNMGYKYIDKCKKRSEVNNPENRMYAKDILNMFVNSKLYSRNKYIIYNKAYTASSHYWEFLEYRYNKSRKNYIKAYRDIYSLVILENKPNYLIYNHLLDTSLLAISEAIDNKDYYTAWSISKDTLEILEGVKKTKKTSSKSIYLKKILNKSSEEIIKKMLSNRERDNSAYIFNKTRELLLKIY